MTNEQEKARELAKLLNAFADEKQLQYKNHNDCWKDWTMNITTQKICSTAERTRIKPETKRVPLTMQDLIDRINEGKTMWVKLDFRIALITDFHDDANGDNRVYFQCDQQSYIELMSYTFLDGTPCYKEVECE